MLDDLAADAGVPPRRGRLPRRRVRRRDRRAARRDPSRPARQRETELRPGRRPCARLRPVAAARPGPEAAAGRPWLTWPHSPSSDACATSWASTTTALDFLGRYDAADLRRPPASRRPRRSPPRTDRAFRRAAAAGRLLPAPVRRADRREGVRSAAVLEDRGRARARPRPQARRAPARAVPRRPVPHARRRWPPVPSSRPSPPDGPWPWVPSCTGAATSTPLARFIDVVPFPVIPPMLDARRRRRVPPARGRGRRGSPSVSTRSSRTSPTTGSSGIVARRAASDHLAEAVLLISELGPEQAARALELVVGATASCWSPTWWPRSAGSAAGTRCCPCSPASTPRSWPGSPPRPRSTGRSCSAPWPRTSWPPDWRRRSWPWSEPCPPGARSSWPAPWPTGAPGVARELYELVQTVPGAGDLPGARVLRAAVGD